MRRFELFLFIVFIVISCSEGEKTNVENQQEEQLPLIENKNGIYKEWYPGRKQLKIEGRKDSEGRRTGIWKSYAENGVQTSISIYSKGMRDGHIIVYYPNGALHYKGEYSKDKRVGEWAFYNKQGEIVKVENFDEKEEE